MTQIVFIDHTGAETAVDAKDGVTLMEAATAAGIPGVWAECGGACACATCHVFVADADYPRVGPPGDLEESMLDFNEQRRPTSRLSCQIKISPELAGLRVTTPEKQY